MEQRDYLNNTNRLRIKLNYTSISEEREMSKGMVNLTCFL